MVLGVATNKLNSGFHVLLELLLVVVADELADAHDGVKDGGHLHVVIQVPVVAEDLFVLP